MPKEIRYIILQYRRVHFKQQLAEQIFCEENKQKVVTDISADGKPYSFFNYCDAITQFTGLTPKQGRSGRQSNKEKKIPS